MVYFCLAGDNLIETSVECIGDVFLSEIIVDGKISVYLTLRRFNVVPMGNRP